MLKIFQVLVALCFAAVATAQTTLPASWDGNGTAPNGFTINGTGTYATGNVAAPSIRLDGTGDFVQVFFVDAPGKVKYALRGQSGSNPNFFGTFTIQESVDGNSWSTLRELKDEQVNNKGFDVYEDMASETSRYIRFFYSNKVSGSNVGLDDILIEKAAAGNKPSLDVIFDSKRVINNSTIGVGTALGTPKEFNIVFKNVGGAPINISSIDLNPANAIFTKVNNPTTIAANTETNLTLSFNPTTAGTNKLKVTVNSNDANIPAYTVNIDGFGNNFASEPVNATGAITFSETTSFRTKTAVANIQAEGCVVLRKEGSAISELPLDGRTYQVGEYIGAAQVVYVGNNASAFYNRNIYSGNTYHFAAYAYNGFDNFINYKTDVVTKGSVTLPLTNAVAGYYNGISATDPTLITKLFQRINPHTQVFYSNFALYVSLFAARDTVSAMGSKVITDVYSGENYVYAEPFLWNYFSREHTFAHSWMPTFPDEDKPSYSDMFNLFPVNQDESNAVRSNFPHGEVVTAQGTYLDAKVGLDKNGKKVYEPRASHKGDVARTLFYMATCYNKSNENWSLPEQISASITYGPDQALLKKWHQEDLPDAFERSRNDFIDSLQKNRNPFIDHPEYACNIDFGNMTYISSPSGCTVGLNENTTVLKLKLYPNPASDELIIALPVMKAKASIVFRDLQGKEVANYAINGELYTQTISVSNLANGFYTAVLSDGENTWLEKVVVQH